MCVTNAKNRAKLLGFFWLYAKCYGIYFAPCAFE